MSRLIDAVKLMQDFTIRQGEIPYYVFYGVIKNTVDKQVTAEQESGWIPCSSERLPKTSWVGGRSEYVQGTCKGYYIPIPVIYDSKSNKWITFGEEEVDVIAWQPLPQPYKEVDSE